MKFYLGAYEPQWLVQFDIPLFVSVRRLRRIKRKFPRALGRWALDSGGFTELSSYGRWTVGPSEYVDSVRFYSETIGNMDWAAPQDWMCEPWIIAKTGLSVLEHQNRTVENFLVLRQMAPELKIIPVLQGWKLPDYEQHIDMYGRAGIDLTVEDTVGLGSVCRRQATSEIKDIVELLSGAGLQLHGFGVKTGGLKQYGHLLRSSDSMAWSASARWGRVKLTDCTHRAQTCANCHVYAFRWRQRVIESLEVKPHPTNQLV